MSIWLAIPLTGARLAGLPLPACAAEVMTMTSRLSSVVVSRQSHCFLFQLLMLKMTLADPGIETGWGYIPTSYSPSPFPPSSPFPCLSLSFPFLSPSAFIPHIAFPLPLRHSLAGGLGERCERGPRRIPGRKRIFDHFDS